MRASLNLQQNISFRAVSRDTIEALYPDITGQEVLKSHGEEYVYQHPEAQYHLLSDFEKKVIVAINDKARLNNYFDVHVVKNPSSKNYINKYGDTLVIQDRKRNVILKKIPMAIGNNLNPIEQINNLKFAVDIAEKMVNDKNKGFFRKFFNKNFDKPVGVYLNKMNNAADIYGNAAYIPETGEVSPAIEEIHYTRNNKLDNNELNISEESISKYLNSREYQDRDKKVFHNVVQRQILSPDRLEELSDGLKQISPLIDLENVFTLEQYNKLTETQKEQMRKLSDKSMYCMYGHERACINVDSDHRVISIISEMIKKNLDIKYGEGKYSLFGIGSSPSALLSVLAAENIPTVNIPYSKSVLDKEDPLKLKGSGEMVDWKKYFASFGLDKSNVQKMEEQGKTIIITDLYDTGETIDILKKTLKEIGLPIENIKFEDLENLWIAETEDTKKISQIFSGIFLEGRKVKLYSSCQNAGKNADFYNNIFRYIGEYKNHPFTKIFSFLTYDKLFRKI